MYCDCQNNRPVTLIFTNSDLTTTNSVIHQNRDGITATYSCPIHLHCTMETWAKLTAMISCVDIIMCSTNAEILLVCVLVLALLGNHKRLHIKPVEPRQQQTETHSGHPCKRTNWYLLWHKRARHSSIGSPTTRFCQDHVPIKVEKSCHH